MKQPSELGTLANHADKIFYDIIVASKGLKKRGFNPETQRAKEIADRIDLLRLELFNDDKVLAVLKETREAVRVADEEMLSTEEMIPVELARQFNYCGA